MLILLIEQPVVNIEAAGGENRLQKQRQGGILSGSYGGVAKWPKATVCKTVIRRFKSGRRLFWRRLFPSSKPTARIIFVFSVAVKLALK